MRLQTDRQTDRRTDGRGDSSIPPPNFVAGGIKIIHVIASLYSLHVPIYLFPLTTGTSYLYDRPC